MCAGSVWTGLKAGQVSEHDVSRDLTLTKLSDSPLKTRTVNTTLDLPNQNMALNTPWNPEAVYSLKLDFLRAEVLFNHNRRIGPQSVEAQTQNSWVYVPTHDEPPNRDWTKEELRHEKTRLFIQTRVRVDINYRWTTTPPRYYLLFFTFWYIYNSLIEGLKPLERNSSH